MMNPDPVYQRLRETGWRRPLTEAEQAELRAWLASHPEARPDVEADAVVSDALAKLPDAPLPSNFTARVLQAIDAERVAEQRATPKSPWWRALLPRLAGVATVIALAGAFYWRSQIKEREELVDAAEIVMTVAGDGLVLEDFEVIRQLGQADEGLLALSDDLMSLKP